MSSHLHRGDPQVDGSYGSCLECEEERAAIARSALLSGKIRSTGVIYALCPFHDERTPSLVYRPRSGRFACYGCHVRGILTGGLSLVPTVTPEGRQLDLTGIV